MKHLKLVLFLFFCGRKQMQWQLCAAWSTIYHSTANQPQNQEMYILYSSVPNNAKIWKRFNIQDIWENANIAKWDRTMPNELILKILKSEACHLHHTLVIIRNEQSLANYSVLAMFLVYPESSLYHCVANMARRKQWATRTTIDQVIKIHRSLCNMGILFWSFPKVCAWQSVHARHTQYY